ncbi:hypothetical protein LAZ67_3000483 [Cordylochernes scorpioides]|uniref:Mariner Mos1 transposase n=1 Tax=Cordylochernes scorpioides TaxID=51811 RepID=A0ABY6K6H6_9ARAC|nr:hypothetical protein LAZ67_3000483 [Cordylochernes scorpioides]
MATVFWDSQEIILIDYLKMKKKKTITGEYYATLLDRLKEELRAKGPRLARKKVLFHHDNVPPHSCQIVRIRFPIGPSSTLFPRFGPVWLLPLPKSKEMAGRKFFSSNEKYDDVNGYFENLETSYFSEGMKNPNIAGPGNLGQEDKQQLDLGLQQEQMQKIWTKILTNIDLGLQNNKNKCRKLGTRRQATTRSWLTTRTNAENLDKNSNKY